MAQRYGLARVFGDSYDSLTERQAALVAADYSSALEEDGCTYEEYARRIGRSNLTAYVACLEVGARL